MSDANSKKYRKTVQSENENIIINTTQKISKLKKELASLHYVTIMDDKNKKVQDYLARMEIPIELNLRFRETGWNRNGKSKILIEK